MTAHAVFVCDAVRTPIGRYGGALSSVRTDDLAAHPIAVLLARNPTLNPEAIDDVILGCANQAGEDNRNVARMAALLAGLPDTVPGMTVNRLCASGAEAVASAAARIASGQIDLCIAGGVESMSRAPYVLGKGTQPFSRSQRLEDTTIGWRLVNPSFHERFGTDPMPTTAENVAETHGVSRRDQDAFALQSQQRAMTATSRAFFLAEIAPIEVTMGRSVHSIGADEHPRPDTTIDALERLTSIVRSGGTVTAGNSSGINDGAAAMVLANEETVERHGLIPRARVLGAAGKLSAGRCTFTVSVHGWPRS